MAAIGIDWATYHCVVAKRNDTGSVEVCVNEMSNRSTPTMLSFDRNQVLVGEQCEARINVNPEQSITNLAQALGSKTEPGDDELWTANDGLVSIFFNGEDTHVSVEEVVALYMKKIHGFTGITDENASKVIAVPDWYSQEQIDALHRAIVASKIGIAKYVRHSDALCAQYLKTSNKGNILIVDVGYYHTTCILANFEEEVEIKSRETVKVGTKYLIDIIAKKCIQRAKDKYNQEVTLKSKKGYRLKTACEKALKQLSMGPVADISLEYWLDDDVDFHMEITPEQVAAAAAEGLEQIKNLITKIKGEEEIVKVEVVGGGGRSAIVQDVICQASGITMDDLCRGMDGSSGVAVGAVACAIKEHFTVTPTESEEKIDEMTERICKIKEVDRRECARLEARNNLEGYIYECRGWCDGPHKNLMNAAVVLPYLDAASSWFLDQEEDLLEQVYLDKHAEITKFIKENAPEYFAKKEEEKNKMEAELEALQANTNKQEKEDHDTRKLPKSERLRLAEKNRLEGNDMFAANNYVDAVSRYMKAQGHLGKMHDLSPQEEEQKNKILLSCHLNTAQCYLKGTQGEQENRDEAMYKKVKVACNSALEIDATNIKALFRRALAAEKLKDFESASKDLKKGLELDPTNKEFIQAEARVTRMIAIQKQKEKKMYGKMFG